MVLSVSHLQYKLAILTIDFQYDHIATDISGNWLKIGSLRCTLCNRKHVTCPVPVMHFVGMIQSVTQVIINWSRSLCTYPLRLIPKLRSSGLSNQLRVSFSFMHQFFWGWRTAFGPVGERIKCCVHGANFNLAPVNSCIGSPWGTFYNRFFTVHCWQHHFYCTPNISG